MSAPVRRVRIPLNSSGPRLARGDVGVELTENPFDERRGCELVDHHGTTVGQRGGDRLRVGIGRDVGERLQIS